VLHHQGPLVGGKRTRLLNEALRQDEHADVLEEQAGGEVAQPCLVEQPPPYDQAGDGRVDRVLHDVRPRRHPVAEGHVAVVKPHDLVMDPARHRGELVERLVGEKRARHGRRLLEGAGQSGARVIARPE
jgi:hypothetical protein